MVIGNPPYKEKAKNRGGWVESVSRNSPEPPPLAAWMPPAEWGVGAHAKHLRNLYLYFWRWATWKVFDHDPAANYGIVCFITVAGFLNGPGFERMRDYLRCFLAKKKRQPSATASARAVRSQGLVIP